MSRGLGIEQRGILSAMGREPDRWWPRNTIQQAAWGKRMPHYEGRCPDGNSPTHHWVKNVRWWRNGKELTEGHFSRALYGLERRGLIERPERGPSLRERIIAAGRDPEDADVSALVELDERPRRHPRLRWRLTQLGREMIAGGHVDPHRRPA